MNEQQQQQLHQLHLQQQELNQERILNNALHLSSTPLSPATFGSSSSLNLTADSSVNEANTNIPENSEPTLQPTGSPVDYTAVTLDYFRNTLQSHPWTILSNMSDYLLAPVIERMASDWVEWLNTEEGSQQDQHRLLRSSVWLALFGVGKRILHDDKVWKESMTKLIASAQDDPDELVQLCRTLAKGYMADGQDEDDFHLQALDAASPTFSHAVVSLKQILYKEKFGFVPFDISYLDKDVVKHMLESKVPGWDSKLSCALSIKADFRIPPASERLKKYTAARQDTPSVPPPLTHRPSSSNILRPPAASFLRKSNSTINRAKLPGLSSGMGMERRRMSGMGAGLGSPLSSGGGKGFIKESRIKTLTEDELHTINSIEEDARKKAEEEKEKKREEKQRLEEEKERKREEKMRMEEERKFKKLKAEEERRKKMEERKATTSRRKSDISPPGSPSESPRPAKKKRISSTASSPSDDPTLVDFGQHPVSDYDFPPHLAPHVPSTRSPTSMRRESFERQGPSRYSRYDSQRRDSYSPHRQEPYPPQRQEPYPPHRQDAPPSHRRESFSPRRHDADRRPSYEQDRPPLRSPVQTAPPPSNNPLASIWNEINALADSDRILIEQFISGQYAQRDEQKKIKLHQTSYSDPGTGMNIIETLYIQLDYDKCEWKKIRTKAKAPASLHY